MISNMLCSKAAKLALITAAAATAFTLGAVPANADNAPPQACGATQPGPCTETDHYTNENGLQTPLGTPTSQTNCPSWVTADYVVLAMSGNGIEHVTINKAQDFWFTTTFTGQGTATFYPPSSITSVVLDQNGNVVSFDIVGPADTTITGHLTNWFGGSGNNKNAVFHGTISLQGTDGSGNAVSLHSTQHQNWTGTQVPVIDEPHNQFADITC